MASAPRFARDDFAQLGGLVELFYPNLQALGEFRAVEPAEMPLAERILLAHDQHMTLTVEAFHRCFVDVEVLSEQRDERYYSRLIALKRQSDGGVVQFGIVRLDTDCLAPQVRDEIVSGMTPLGRVLIKYNVLRHIRLCQLWEIAPAPPLVEFFRMPSSLTCYGRSACIDLDGQPAIELLEIVTPLPPIS